MLLDYSQAFKYFNQDMLLAKISFYGELGEGVITWVRSYQHHRDQVTSIGSEQSESLLRVRGVPQGSRLGTILFHLHISCNPHLYVDDC